MHLPSLRQKPSTPLPSSAIPEDDENVADPPVVIDLTYHSTRANEFGLYRIYKTLPSVDPDDSIDIEDLADGPHFVDSGARSQRTANLAFGHEFNAPPSAPFYAPYENVNTFRLVQWAHENTQVTLSGLQRLVDDVIRPQTPEVFRPEDFLGFSASTEYNRLDRAISQDHDAASGGPLPWTAASGWRSGSIPIPVPCPGKKCAEDAAPVYEVKGLHYRNIQEVIKEAFQDEQSREYHLRAHKVFWERTADEHPMRCWGEAYTSDRALEMDDELLSLEGEPGCTLERIAAWLMSFSDSTHLADFGNASMWPIYLMLGNLSKYTRGKPTAFAQHHLAYIPSLPDDFADWYIATFGVRPSDAIKTHMKREIVQGVWRILLTPELIEAYTHGMVVGCADGVLRRTFPRFFAYSSDYLEK
ncbi:hypothetical protein EV121DRAFT_280730 [Schizophyllum commune]